VDQVTLLAIQPNRVVPVDEIVDVVWGDDPPATGRSLVHGHVRQVRRLIEPARRPRAPAERVVRTDGGYLLVADDDLDLVRFDRLVATARRRHEAGDVAGAIDAYAEGLDCWRGGVLSDLDDPALHEHPAAVAAAGRRLSAALAYADLAVGSGRHDEAVPRLQALAAEERLHEGLHARLMLALAGAGRQADALALLGELRGRLAEELGVEPGADVRAAHLRVLRQQVPAAAEHPDGRDPPGPPAQLPADLSTFTGRVGALRRLDALLSGDVAAPSGVAIGVIVGTAGVGKTTLAVHWAHRVTDRFPDGQLFVNLRGYASAAPIRPAEVLARFLHALGVPADQVPIDPDEAAALYRSVMAGRRALVVLDNARDAPQVRPLLPGGPGNLVLVTSRDRLTGLRAREGAVPVLLDVLTPNEAHRLLARVLPPHRVRAEPDAIPALAQACAYLPLALGIAAANVAAAEASTGEHAGVARYVARLCAGNRLAELEVDGDPDSAVQATFDLSYATLAADAARLFRRLGLVPGPTCRRRSPPCSSGSRSNRPPGSSTGWRRPT
jgi:DNA-binding SARP family transcriptional activator